MNALELQLCDIQGRLFELSVDRNLDSARFIKIFMNSETARALDASDKLHENTAKRRI